MSSENSNDTEKNLEDEDLYEASSLVAKMSELTDMSLMNELFTGFSNELLKMTSEALASNLSEFSKIPAPFEGIILPNPFEPVLRNDLWDNLLHPVYESIKNSIPKFEFLSSEALIYQAHSILGKNLLAWWMDLSLEEAEQVCSYGTNKPEELNTWIKDVLIPNHTEFIEESFKIINNELNENNKYLRGLSLAAQRSFERNEPEGIGALLVPVFDKMAYKYRQKKARPTAIRKNFESINETCEEAELFECSYEIQNVYLGFANAFPPFVENFDFEKDPEPEDPNRHWLSHGHATKKFDMLNAYKLLSLLTSLILLGRFCNDYSEVLIKN